MEHAVLLVVGELTDVPQSALTEALNRVKRVFGERGVWLEEVSAGPDDDPVGLARQLLLLDDPDTLCLVLIGGQYGRPAPQLSAEVRTSLPELTPFAGSSRLELFTRCALEPSRRSRAVFVLEPLASPPGTGANGREPPDLDERNALTRLRQAVTDADAAVVELSPGESTSRAEPTAAVDRLVDALLHARQSTVTTTAPPPVQYDENVQFTVYRPKAVRPNECYELLAFAHLADRRPDAPDDQLDPLEEVRRQAHGLLGPSFDDYSDPRADSRQSIPRAGELTFLPQVPGVEFTPERRVFRWLEDVQREEFQLVASETLAGRTARGRLSVYLGAIIVAEVDLAFKVDWGARSASAQPALQATEQARPYRKIFASYSHQDTEIVEQFSLLAQSMGDEYLRDVVSLRAGSPWDQGLLELIDQADVFQLFWSSHSMRSPHVRREWEYAVQLRRPFFIRPTYWEDPLPSTHEPELPPSYLRELHFHQIRRTEQRRVLATPGPTAPGSAAAAPGSAGPPPAPAAAPAAPPASSAAAWGEPPAAGRDAAPAAPTEAWGEPPADVQAAPAAEAAPPRRRTRARFVPLGSAAAAVGIASSLLFSPLGSSFRSGEPPVSTATGTVVATSAPTPTASEAATTDPTTAPTTAPPPQSSTPSGTPVRGSEVELVSLQVTDSEAGTVLATQRPGEPRSTVEVSRGQRVALSLTFANSGTSARVQVGAVFRCRDEAGGWVEPEPEVVEVEVPEGQADQGPVGRWESKAIVVPRSCRVHPDFDPSANPDSDPSVNPGSDEADGQVTGWADASSWSKRAEIVADLKVK